MYAQSLPIQRDVWGVVSGSNYSSIGFTGEWSDTDTGMVFLHARWYNPSSGTFLSRDPFAGYPTQPYSLHAYQYGYSSPLVNTDHSGRVVIVIGGNGSEQKDPATATDVGVWQLGDKLLPLVGEVWKYSWNSTEKIKQDIRSRFRVGLTCPPKPLYETHLVIIGHSLGASTAQEVAFDLQSEYIFDLVITLAMITYKGYQGSGSNSKTYSGGVYSTKHPNVLRHINLTSDRASSLRNIVASAPEIRDVSNAENMYVEHSTHATLDNEEITDDKGHLVPNPAWSFIEQAIIDLSRK